MHTSDDAVIADYLRFDMQVLLKWLGLRSGDGEGPPSAGRQRRASMGSTFSATRRPIGSEKRNAQEQHRSEEHAGDVKPVSFQHPR